jgi:hypothetical protein
VAHLIFRDFCRKGRFEFDISRFHGSKPLLWGLIGSMRISTTNLNFGVADGGALGQQVTQIKAIKKLDEIS